MREQLLEKLNQLSDADFIKVKKLYALNGIKGNTRKEFVDNTPDKTVQGMINLCNMQLNGTS